MYKILRVSMVGILLGAGGMYYFLNGKVESKHRFIDTWSPKPFSQSTKKYIGDAVAGGMAYSISSVSPFLTESARIAISQDYYGAPNEGTQKHTVAAEYLECVAREEQIHECSVRFSEVETRAITGENATILWDSLQSSGIATQTLDQKSVIAKNIICTVDDHMAQTTPGNTLLGFGCTFE